jgi:hypothetical protein
VVSRLSWMLLNPMPLSLNPLTTSMRCPNERPKRSSFQTTRMSPSRFVVESFIQSGSSRWESHWQYR